MDWLISFGMGAFIFILTLIGIVIFTWLGECIRMCLEKVALPLWTYYLIGTIFVVLLFGIVIHIGLYGVN